MTDSLEKRLADRRKIDHIIVPDRRMGDRRVPEPVIVSESKKIAQRAVAGTARISSHVSKEQVDKRILDGMDALIAALDARNALTDSQAVEALSTEATLMFAESKPCWMEEEKCFQATASS